MTTRTATGNAKLDSALACARRGWPVVLNHSVKDGRCSCGCDDPGCKTRGKHPRLGDWWNKASTDEAEIRAWWRTWPDANVGIATGARSGIWVLDIDPDKGGNDTLAMLEGEHGKLPATVEAITGSLGRHLVFAHPGPHIYIRTDSAIAAGVDVRADGGNGQFIIEPSIHWSGNQYHWEMSADPADTLVAIAPKWLLDFVGAREAGAKGGNGHAKVVGEEIQDGARDDTLTSLAGSMRRRGMTEAEILAALLVVNENRCKPPLPESAVAKIARSIAKKAPEAVPRFHVEEPPFAEERAENDSADVKEEVSAERKLRFWTAREIAELIPAEVDWIAKPWVVAGAITEVDGKIKAAGKTTWVTHLCRAVLDGADFMGEATAKTGVMYLTEQPLSSFRQALQLADLVERDDFSVVLWHETAGIEWARVVEETAREAHKRGAGVLVVDVLSRFAKIAGDGENSSGPALEAMEPLKMAAAIYNLAIIIVRHERKGGGEVGESGRGSSAYSGEVDIVLSVRRPEGNAAPTVRAIHALSRFRETPDKLVIELTDNGYVSLGSEDDYAVGKARAALMESLPADGANAIAVDKLTEALKTSRATLQTALEALMTEGNIGRCGAGKKGDPYRYWRV